ncbi:kinase-like protein [Mucor ambiguus]|uniref:dual-specificity kinase n=1 Tax=Mucor ambiguus TaxID=91626 RepID=A0A0C9M3P5_9FUNG|nr:kinase-like protein [Mucor ambiguus]
MMSSQKLYVETDFDSGTTTAKSSQQQPKVALSTSASSLSLPQEPWNKVQSSYAAKRKQMQAERMRQLKELEEQVAETSNWNQRRKDLVTTSSRRLTLTEDNNVYPASNSSSPSTSSTPPRSRQASNGSGDAAHRIDLGDATLEDLEGLIAASAKRLASYRLRNQKLDATSQELSSSSPPKKTNDDMDKWKQLLDSNDSSSSNSSIQRISTTACYNSDAALAQNYAPISPVATLTKSTSQMESGEKSPSASYLRLRNMFEKDTHYKKLDTNTLLSSKAPQPQPSEPSFSKKSTSSFSLADLAHPPSSPSSSSSSTLLSSHRKTIQASNGWKNQRDEPSSITSTRSSISSATTPKIESPRISASTTPRVSTSSIHLRKAPRSHLSQSQAASASASISASLSSSSSSSLIDQQKKNGDATATTTRSRKLSTLASLQQRQRQHHVAIKQQDQTDKKDDNDIKSVDDYVNSIKKTSSALNARSHRAESSNSSEEVSHRRKVKLSITTSSNVNSASSSSSSSSNIRKPKETSTLSKPHTTTATAVVRRKRGKTLPGSLASQPSIAPLSLPPMKVEPLNIPSVHKHTRTVAKTPTRIPLPANSSNTATGATSTAPSTSTTKQRLAIAARRTADSSDDDHQYKTSKNICMTSKIKQQQQHRQLRKPKSTSIVSSTPKLQSSRSNKSTDDNTLRKNTSMSTSTSTSTSTSATTATTPTSSSTTTNNGKQAGGLASSISSKSMTSVSASKRKVPTLQERLQGLVDESRSWTTQMEKEKTTLKTVEGHTSEIILRGRGTSTTTSNHSNDPVVKKLLGGEHPKVMMRVAMSPEAAQKLYQFNLTSYEKQEMQNYENIYFVGHHAKKRPASPSQSFCNYGYDDERGDYLIQIRDHLDYRYEVLELMGKGSFGQVLKCFDHRSGQTVAVKIIRNKKRFHAQALVEVKILEELIAWDPEDKHNNVRMTSHFMFRNHLCIAFECLSINLYEFIKSNGFQGFSMGLIRRFAMQLLNSLTLLQKHKLIHCDLKPEHPSKSTIKVIDFGSSCLESEKVYTYIQSRFYRSPEVIMGMSYSMAIDMWSVGCILAELHTGYPLFPGENEQEQLACIMEIQGVPEPYIIEKSTRRKLFFDSQGNPRIQPNSKGRKRRPGTKTLEHALKTTDENFLDFINKCLHWDPEQRLKPDEALKHSWMLKSTKKHSIPR